LTRITRKGAKMTPKGDAEEKKKTDSRLEKNTMGKSGQNSLRRLEAPGARKKFGLGRRRDSKS